MQIKIEVNRHKIEIKNNINSEYAIITIDGDKGENMVLFDLTSHELFILAEAIKQVAKCIEFTEKKDTDNNYLVRLKDINKKENK